MSLSRLEDDQGMIHVEAVMVNDDCIDTGDGSDIGAPVHDGREMCKSTSFEKRCIKS